LGNYMAVNLILFGSTTNLYYERKVYGWANVNQYMKKYWKGDN
jgi:hypothetical protein